MRGEIPRLGGESHSNITADLNRPHWTALKGDGT